MKKSIYIAFLTSVFFTSCENYLEPKIDNSYGQEIVWSLPDYALGVLNNAYAGINNDPSSFNNNYLDVATDNACCNDLTSTLYQYAYGGMTPTANFMDNWTTSYNQFRNIHLFMENGLGDNIKYHLTDPATDQAIRRRSLGECYFLRAWWGMNLLMRFGGLTADGQSLGYCIVTRNLTDADRDDAEMMRRNSYEECVRQIMNDCDSAIVYLPLVYSDANSNSAVQRAQAGRASGRAAYALKARAALFGASPAYQPEGSFAITATELQERWKRAAVAAYDAINPAKGSVGGYTALTNTLLVGSAVQSNESDEMLFRKWYNNNNIEKRNYPPMFFGSGNACPSQNLIDAFPSKTGGFPITDSRSGYDPQNPWANRDNRLANTIYRNGEMFGSERELEIFEYENGAPARDNAGGDPNNTRTGYYLKKGLSTKKNLLFNPSNLGSSNDYHQNGLLRRAELYYALAEALNELGGPTGSIAEVPGFTAYSILKDIRSKNGITATTYLDEVSATGKESFRSLILNERRLEFAFENLRFFDQRRCNLPLDESIRGIRIVKNSASGMLEYHGTSVSDPIVVEERSVLSNPKYRYLPLPYNETVKNKNLIQNKGW